ncbi:hypothetical protein L6452_01157 [Arctium lappa]|uniref:Uncharacterized protein n=1 Tax=Arctium lappa TaxID=4217 RepID=A0ACB9FHC7_ARCLA|nr:hypothetical protein L6452_01157 [Arctium lappa]
MAGSDDVVLLNFWASPFGARVKIALAEKGVVNYDYKEEKLADKSSLLLKMNPVHKKVPVLIHHGKPICESNIIVQYIDETWQNDDPPLLPSDPYLKAQARFWADFVDSKVRFSGIWRTKGEEQESAKKEFIDLLKVLEGQLGEKPYLIGESFGYADIAVIPLSCWFYALETVGKMNIGQECPKLIEWVERCMERESVSKSLPDPHKIYEYLLEKMKKLG